MDAFGYDETDFIPCEISGARCQDIHHIIGRGKIGGDTIENLMGLTRKNHTDYGDKKDYMVLLLKIHRKVLQIKNIPFNDKFFEFYINKYEK